MLKNGTMTSERIDQWCKKVGGEQKLLPAHMVNEYCRPDRPFKPCPSEWESKLPRTREMEVWDSSQSKTVKGSWFIPPLLKMGLDLIMLFYRCGGRCSAGASRCRLSGGPVAADLKALQSLWKTRTQQLELLRSQLLSRLVKARYNTELKKLKYQTPVQSAKSVSMPPPKTKSQGSEQLELQDHLIAACKRGDEKAVNALFMRGAKPEMTNAKGEQPLGAAVWGMCPGVVNALLKQAGGIAPMSWEECEKHNRERYQEVFIVPKFNPKTYGEWYALLGKMNPFITEYHLNEAYKQWDNRFTRDWGGLLSHVKYNMEIPLTSIQLKFNSTPKRTEKCYEGFRTQIKQGIEAAKQPTLTMIG